MLVCSRGGIMVHKSIGGFIIIKTYCISGVVLGRLKIFVVTNKIRRWEHG